MLVLQRKASEKICIGSTITIVVQSIRGSKVQIGIVAPASVKIFRPEAKQPQAESIESYKKIGLEQQTILSLLDCVTAVGIPVTDAVRLFVSVYAEQFSYDIIGTVNENAN